MSTHPPAAEQPVPSLSHAILKWILTVLSGIFTLSVVVILDGQL